MKKMLLIAIAMFALTIDSEAAFIGSGQDCYDYQPNGDCTCEETYQVFWIVVKRGTPTLVGDCGQQ